MKPAGIASLLLGVTLLSGCCSSGACVPAQSPCDRELAGGGFPWKGLLHHKCKRCKSTCGCDSAAHGCAVPVGSCGDPAIGCGVPAAAPMGCGCGAHQGVAPAPLPVPPQTQPAPVPVPSPNPAPPAPPAEAALQPAPAVSSTTSRLTTAQPQQVSYEEFQRLPGVIISGPGAVPTAPAAAAAVSPAPVAPVPAVATPAAGAWQPAR